MKSTASATIVAAAVIALAVIPLLADATDLYSEWSTPVNVGAPVNMAGAIETDAFITQDGLSLYFACSNCPGGYGMADIYVSHRASPNDPWGAPQNLGPAINTPFEDFGPTVTLDGHWMYFTSNRPGGAGGNDIYVTRRRNKRDDFAWRLAENVVSINTLANESSAAPFEDDVTGVTSLYFASDRPGSLGDDDVWVATLQSDENFSPATLVAELSSCARERHTHIRRDGLELFVMSNRPGSIPNLQGLPSLDLWVATRSSTSDPWSTPVNLGPVVNSRFHDGRPSISFDATTLYFFSARPGGSGPCTPSGAPPCVFDLWKATRTKLSAE